MSNLNPYAGPQPLPADTAAPPAPVPVSRRWMRFWAWVGLVAGVVVTFAGTTVASLVVYLGQSASCGDVADQATIQVGMRSLVAVLGVAAVPWAVALFFSQHKVLVGVAAVIALAPVLFALGYGFTPGAWNDGWCIG